MQRLIVWLRIWMRWRCLWHPEPARKVFEYLHSGAWHEDRLSLKGLTSYNAPSLNLTDTCFGAERVSQRQGSLPHSFK